MLILKNWVIRKKINNPKFKTVKLKIVKEKRLKKEALSSTSDWMNPLLKKAKKYSLNFVPLKPFKRKIIINSIIKVRVTQSEEISIFSIACKLFGFLLLTQN